MTASEIKIIDTFPAYTIFGGKKVFSFGDTFAVGYETQRHGRLYDFFTLGSVASYAARYGEDPEDAVVRAKGFGHDLYWATKHSTVIHNGPKTHSAHWAIEIGDEIEVDGIKFRVKRTANQTIKLIKI